MPLLLLHTFRVLRKSPGFTLATILLLALGIGGAVLVFSAFDAILLRELPIREPEELAVVRTVRYNAPPTNEYPWKVFDAWRARSRSFTATFAQSDLEVSVTDGGASYLARAEIVTGDYFTTLGIAPVLGRLLTKHDEWGAANGMAAVLSYDFWSRRFDRDPAILGQVIHPGGQPFVIVGVTPRGFNGISADTGIDIRVPLIAGQVLTENGARNHDPTRCCFWEIAGRLRPGLSDAQVQSENSATMAAAWATNFSFFRPLDAEDHRWIQRQHLRVERIGRGMSWLRDRFSNGLFALMGAVALILLLCCANVAGLMVARVAARQQEIAVRLALGATRAQLALEWMIECAVLTVLGAAGGMLITLACLPFFDRLMPTMRNMMTEQLPVRIHVGFDGRLFAFAVLACCITCALAGAGPALAASKTDLLTSLKSTASDVRRGRFRAVLVALQVAICTMVLADAALMVETLRHLDRLDAGFDRDRVVTFSVDTALARLTQADRIALALRLVRGAREVPGVSAAALAMKPVMRGSGMKITMGLPGSHPSASDELNASSNVVTPGYFKTMGIRLLAGRDFDDRDSARTKPVPVVVNRSFAERFFPRGNAVGQLIDSEAGRQIVGIVADSKYRSLREPFSPTIFERLSPDGFYDQQFFELEVRTRSNPGAVIPAMQSLLRSIDPRVPFREIHTLREDVDSSLWAERTLARLGTLFSALAIMLAAVGIYGLISWSLTQRTREIGIRMAVGATPSNIVRGAMARSLALVIGGVAVGLGAAFATGQLMRALLYEASPADPLAGLSGGAVVIAVAVLATLLPAVRAARLDPGRTLRY